MAVTFFDSSRFICLCIMLTIDFKDIFSSPNDLSSFKEINIVFTYAFDKIFLPNPIHNSEFFEVIGAIFLTRKAPK